MTSRQLPQTMSQVRQQVDEIDDLIVPLLVQRAHCMHDAARIKTQAHQVRDEPRIEAIVQRVRALAQSHGGDADLIESTYRAMMELFIAYETQLFAQKTAALTPINPAAAQMPP